MKKTTPFEYQKTTIEGSGIVIEKEVWKDIQGFEGLYMISSYGRVLSVSQKGKKGSGRAKKERLLKLKVNEKGYLIAQLWKNNKGHLIRVHRLVATHFISNLSNLSDVDHKDFNRQNNYYKNLQWIDHEANLKRSYGNIKRGKGHPCYGKKGSLHPLSKKVAQIDSSGKIIKTYECLRAACLGVGVTIDRGPALSRAIRKGYHFRGWSWKFI